MTVLHRNRGKVCGRSGGKAAEDRNCGLPVTDWTNNCAGLL